MIHLLDFDWTTKKYFDDTGLSIDSTLRFVKNNQNIDVVDILEDLDAIYNKNLNEYNKYPTTKKNKWIKNLNENRLKSERLLFEINYENEKIISQRALDFIHDRYYLNNSGHHTYYSQLSDGFALNIDVVRKLCPYVQLMLQKSDNICHKRGSYGLKHIFERIIGEYVSNGDMIATMIYKGFRFQFYELNADFNISTRSMELLSEVYN